MPLPRLRSDDELMDGAPGGFGYPISRVEGSMMGAGSIPEPPKSLLADLPTDNMDEILDFFSG